MDIQSGMGSTSFVKSKLPTLILSSSFFVNLCLKDAFPLMIFNCNKESFRATVISLLLNSFFSSESRILILISVSTFLTIIDESLTSRSFCLKLFSGFV